MKESVEFENEQVKPHKIGGTRWIDYKVKAMKRYIDKYGLYLQHIENVIADTKNQTGKSSHSRVNFASLRKVVLC